MRILLIEDNLDLGDAISRKLCKEGHSVEWLCDGGNAVSRSRRDDWDAIVLDIMLPGKDGFAVLGDLRAIGCKTPVLIVTARSEIDDKVDMLNLGADDYLVKPFDLRELEARLRALLRRPAGHASNVVTYGNLAIDLAARSVLVAGVPLELGRREFRLLEAMLARAGKAIPKERLMAQLFQDGQDVSPNALELLVSRLRRKLAPSSVDICTVRGVGYLARINA
jgi:two-component system, OmpR family, response regulator TctD